MLIKSFPKQFMLLMSEAILVFSPQSSFFGKSSRDTKVKSHWIIMVVALICAAAGILPDHANR